MPRLRHTNVKLDPEAVERAQAIARIRGQSVSQVLRDALAIGLPALWRQLAGYERRG